jgi:prepilin-type N-terminal cleavage/methylation domain-containing protein
MRLVQPRQQGRNGFTLIELLVVIAIIAILVGLTAAAVIQYLNKIPVINTTNDIQQLATALENFKTKFGFYPPSRIRLCSSQTMYANAGVAGSLDQLSLAYLNQMFPRMVLAGADWSGGVQPGFSSVILEGDECLVFFLGGIPTNNPTPGCLGFSTDPHSPWTLATVANNQRIGPFFTFDTSRLVQIHAADPTSPSAFYSYKDSYDKNQVFAYFQSGKTPNGYNSLYQAVKVSDCNLLSVWPYAEFMAASAADQRPPRYLNPTTYQILSAGRDGIFGRGTPIASWTNMAIVGATPVTTWTGSNPGAMAYPGPPANYNYKDDQSNFAPGILEAGS